MTMSVSSNGIVVAKNGDNDFEISDLNGSIKLDRRQARWLAVKLAHEFPDLALNATDTDKNNEEDL